MTDNVAEKILELARKRFDTAEVFEEPGESLSVSFDDNRLKDIETKQFHGVGLRVIQKGRVGFAATTDLTDPERLVQMAGDSARYGDEARFDLPGQPGELEVPETYDEDVPDVSAQNMVEMGRAGLEMSRERNDEFLYSCGIGRSTHRQRLLNSAGLDHSSRSTGMSYHVGVQVVKESGSMLHVYDWDRSGHPLTDVREKTALVLDKTDLALNEVRTERQKMPVVFTPFSLNTLLGPLNIALNGKHVHRGSSVLAERKDVKVFDERFTVQEDPTVPFASGSCALDDEGTPTRKRHLFENGVLRSFVADRQTAGLLGWEPTGNGFRSFSSQPSPSTTNTIVAAGEQSYEEIVSGLDRGLIVEQTLGGHTNNALAGEFSVNVSLGFLVENGEIVGRVKDAMIAGNIYELLSDNLEAISSDRRWRGSSLVPSIMVGGITLAVE